MTNKTNQQMFRATCSNPNCRYTGRGFTVRAHAVRDGEEHELACHDDERHQTNVPAEVR